MPVDLPIEAGVQDDLSIQVALMQELLRGRTPSTFRLLDRNVIKDYQYTPEGTAKLTRSAFEGAAAGPPQGGALPLGDRPATPVSGAPDVTWK